MSGVKWDRIEFIIDNDNMQRKCFLYISRKTIYGSSHRADIYLVFEEGTLPSGA